MEIPPRDPNGRPSLIRSFCRRESARSYSSRTGGVLGSPMARRLICSAAVRYRSNSTGDTAKTSAMLSKPWAPSSAGSNDLSSISTPSRSRIALAYSDRFRRWMAASLPGSGLASAARSSSVSTYAAKESEVALSGRGIPGGGICPARSLRITFSHTSAPAGIFSMSTLLRISPAVLSFSLWQVMQYRLSTARYFDGACGSGLDGSCADTERQPTAANATPRIVLNIVVSLLFCWLILAGKDS